MGEKILNIRIKNKYDTEANWIKNDPILLRGEVAYTSDRNNKFKIGDGTSKWSALSYAKANLEKSDVTTALGYTPPTSNTWRGIQNNLTSDSTTESLAAAQGKALKSLIDGKAPSEHTHDDRYYTETEINDKLKTYLPLSGGTLHGKAFISWPDTNNWSNNNDNVTFPVTRGGLSWSGQSDGIKLFAEETGNDNLELILQFTDDESNGLTIRNSKGVKTARITSGGNFSGNFTGSLSGNASTATKLSTSTAGSATQPVYFSDGKPVACTYTLGKSVPSDAKFTDTVYSHPTTSGNKHIPSGGSSGQILRWSADGTAAWGNDNNTTYSPATATNTGLLSATDKVKLDGIENGANKYIHPAYTAKASGLYKITVDATGHVSVTTTVTKDDITALGIPSTNTTYTVGTTSYSGTTKLYTETGTATDGTMTQNAITTALNTHIHNYAGSSSAGGSANSALKLSTARLVNGTSFDGSSDITTANWGTSRNITIGSTTKSVNGASNVSWTLAEVGIHLSTTEPTEDDGQNGDIWICYEG